MEVKLYSSRPAAWGGMALTVLVIVVLSVFKCVWWCYIPLFFMFMEAFCELASLYLVKMSGAAARSLQNCAFVFGVLTVLAIVGVFIAWQIIL